VQVIFVTLDPERDTAALLRQYTAAFDPSFLGLRGSGEETRRAAQEFKVFYEMVPTGSSYTVNHSAMTYVFDTAGRLRLGLGHSLSADDCAADLRALFTHAS
jgi:protein SCO1/2